MCEQVFSHCFMHLPHIRRAPTQQRWGNEWSRALANQPRPGDLWAGESSLNLKYWAQTKASYATFPGAAFDMEPLGPYAKTYAAALEQARRSAHLPAERTSRDFISRVAYDALQIGRLFDLPPKTASGVNWGLWGEAFKQSCEVLPDPDYMGFVALSERALKEKFQGSVTVLLHHLFEKHNGEIIEVRREFKGVESLASVSPEVRRELHRPQYYVQNSPDQCAARVRARAYFHPPPPGRRHSNAASGAQEFCEKMQDVPNAVYRPTQDHDCEQYEIGYFSLPALVWELFSFYDLLELYTFYCTCRLLAIRKPHPTTKDQLRIDAASVRHTETGKWGFDDQRQRRRQREA